MTESVSVYVSLEVTTCCACGIQFGVPPSFLQKLRENGNKFYCPNGHDLVFRESPVKALEKQLQHERQQHDQTRAEAKRARKLYEGEQRAHRSTKGHLTRTKARLAVGTCPCCEQTFANLAAHMMDAHPDYQAVEEMELPAEGIALPPGAQS